MICNVKLVRYKYFDAPAAHFDNLCLFGDAQAKNIGNPIEILNCKEPTKLKQGVMKWSQIQRSEG
jgi:hypothetical protein